MQLKLGKHAKYYIDRVIFSVARILCVYFVTNKNTSIFSNEVYCHYLKFLSSGVEIYINSELVNYLIINSNNLNLCVVMIL